MAAITLNINADAVVKHTLRLEKLNKRGLPYAVRNSLNSAAFDVKTNTMPKQAKATFTERAPTFFKSTSKVNPATGYSLPNMQAVVGFVKGVKEKETGRATDDLEQQEDSGLIGGRAMIPMNPARAGKKYNRRVSNKNRLAAINSAKVVDAKNSNGKTRQAAFFSSAWFAGKGNYVISNVTTTNGNKMLMRVNSIVRKGGDTVVNSTPLYAVRKGRKVAVKRTSFMRKASTASAEKIERFYIEEAEKQIKRAK